MRIKQTELIECLSLWEECKCKGVGAQGEFIGVKWQADEEAGRSLYCSSSAGRQGLFEEGDSEETLKPR